MLLQAVKGSVAMLNMKAHIVMGEVKKQHNTGTIMFFKISY